VASTKVPRVALLVETSNAYARGLLEGIALYLNQHSHWAIYLPEWARGESLPRTLRGWRGDGMIVRAENRRIATAVTAARIPTIDISAAGLLPKSPAVHSDVRAEAEEAFMHLRERGFRQFGFCGVANYRWAQWQFERFTQLAEKAGCTLASHIETLPPGGAAAWSASVRTLVAWLRKLPKPIGIFACYDIRGQQVLNACRLAGLRVPDDVAVVGVDNDLVRCSLSDPPLSSVVPDTHRVGFQAAELLARLMAGKTVAPGLRLIKPTGVVTRRSSDSLAIADPDIARAVRFIRDHACESISVEDLLREIPLSRRALEGRFLRLLGRTPHQEIIRCRMEKARQLLVETDLPIKAIARQTGIDNAEYFSVLFKKVFGSSPSVCRETGHLTGQPIASRAGK